MNLAADQSVQAVSFSRRFLLRSVLFALLLLWPLLMFGRPAYMDDSAAYQNGGEQAVGFVLRKLHLTEPASRKTPDSALEHKATRPKPAASADSGKDTKVARSIPYSVLSYVLGGPGMTMVWLAMFQAVTTAMALTALFEALAGPGWRPFALMAGIAAFASPLAPIVTFIMPDCYAPVIIGVMAILPLYWTRFSGAMRLLLIGIATLGVALHTSHPPIALGTALAISPLFLLFRRAVPMPLGRALVVLWAPALLGVALVMLSGLIGFGKASISPKHYPLALARAVDNGPARWYLEEECKDRTRYAICEVYGTRIPFTVQEMLWSKDSLITRATPQQLDRVRAEERKILIETTKRYPLQQLYLVAHDVPEQLIVFRLNYFRYDSEIVRNAAGDIVLLSPPGEAQQSRLYGALETLNDGIVAIGALALLWLWRGMSRAQRWAMVIMLTGLLANAAVCAIFSGVAPRYQARVVWLIPWLAIALAWARHSAARGGVKWGAIQ